VKRKRGNKMKKKNIKRQQPTYGKILKDMSVTESEPIMENKSLELAVWQKNNTVLLNIKGILIWFMKEEFIDVVNTLHESAVKLKV
jgi:isocitrate dehydrogenase